MTLDASIPLQAVTFALKQRELDQQDEQNSVINQLRAAQLAKTSTPDFNEQAQAELVKMARGQPYDAAILKAYDAMHQQTYTDPFGNQMTKGSIFDRLGGQAPQASGGGIGQVLSNGGRIDEFPENARPEEINPQDLVVPSVDGAPMQSPMPMGALPPASTGLNRGETMAQVPPVRPGVPVGSVPPISMDDLEKQFQGLKGSQSASNAPAGLDLSGLPTQNPRNYMEKALFDAQLKAKMDAASPKAKPADVQTFEAFQAMSPEEQKSYLDFTKGNKPLTQDEGNAALYADRMREAEAIISGTAPDSMDINQIAKSKVPVAGNFMVTPDFQNAQQAQDNFLNATLRRESGATISDAERSNGKKQYFPQPGDSPEVLSQKSANRATAISGISRAAGPTYKPAPAAPYKRSTNSGGFKYLGTEN